LAVVFVVVLAASGSSTFAQVSKATTERSGDRKELTELVDRFVKAFNAGDAEAAAGTYTESAVVVDETSDRTVGRPAIKSQYEDAFASSPGAKIVIKVEALKFLGAETALEEGQTIITAAKGGKPETTRFTAVYVKEKGRWLQAAVRDEAVAAITAHDRLKDLEWLVGEWVNESDEAVVFTTCKWADGGNFLVREFNMKIKGRPVLSGTQRIGWDPLRKRFKTWVFDSEGGQGEGYWSRIGDGWVIKIEGVRQDGEAVSAKNTIARQGKDRLAWRSEDRTLGGTGIPLVDEFTLVRKAPEVGK